MRRLVLAVGFMVAIGMIAACGTETLPPVEEPSAEELNQPLVQPDTSDEQRLWTLNGDCVVPRSRFAELVVWSPDGNRTVFRPSAAEEVRTIRRSPDGDYIMMIPCDEELRARIESMF